MERILNLVVIWFLFISNLSAHAAFVHVATHQEAYDRYTASDGGREIKVIRSFNNRLYMGYGQDGVPAITDSCDPFYTNPNTGAEWCRLVIKYFDPQTGLLVDQNISMRSQEIDTIEVLNGNMFVPAEDTEGDTLIKCTTTSCGFRDVGTHPDTAHLYSATNLGIDLYIAGSGLDGSARLWKSSDGGDSWNIFRQESAYPGYATRYYFVGGPYNNNIYIRGNYSGLSPWKYNGSTWSNSYDFGSSNKRMRKFAGKLVYVAYNDLYVSNGVNAPTTPFDNPVSTYTISDGWLYLLRADAKSVYRTKDLANFQLVEDTPTTPTSALSLEVLGDHVYVGTTDSRIYKSDKNLSELNLAASIVPPTTLILFE